MERIHGSARSRARTFKGLVGALLIGALAIGLVQTGASASPPVGASAYGGGGQTGNGRAPCTKPTGGYTSTPCPSQVANVSTTPQRPTAGKGFKVSFTSTSGGTYSVSARKASAQSGGTTLERGVTGPGKTTTKTVGKKLKAGKWELTVAVKNSSTGKVARAKLTIKK
jgi:hypothetical protein